MTLDLDRLEALLAAMSQGWRTHGLTNGVILDGDGEQIGVLFPRNRTANTAALLALLDAAPTLIAAARERDRLLVAHAAMVTRCQEAESVIPGRDAALLATGAASAELDRLRSILAAHRPTLDYRAGGMEQRPSSAAAQAAEEGAATHVALPDLLALPDDWRWHWQPDDEGDEGGCRAFRGDVDDLDAPFADIAGYCGFNGEREEVDGTGTPGEIVLRGIALVEHRIKTGEWPGRQP